MVSASRLASAWNTTVYPSAKQFSTHFFLPLQEAPNNWFLTYSRIEAWMEEEDQHWNTPAWLQITTAAVWILMPFLRAVWKPVGNKSTWFGHWKNWRITLVCFPKTSSHIDLLPLALREKKVGGLFVVQSLVARNINITGTDVVKYADSVCAQYE